ncbi:MAG TPA: thiamine pyrophosphate-dependent enzyme [Polyangia bacterium]|nr:thiamine pyrophosphate-dependent enzyme [Polyangia bacterium]
MAGKQLPKIRAGMGDVESPQVEAWSDDDYRRATGLGTILAPDGKADRAGVPSLAPAALRECYRTMLRVRELDELLRAHQKETGEEPRPSARGCEAAIVGAVAALEADDIVVPGRREAGAALWRGHSIAAFLGDQAVPRALGVLPASPHAATQLPHATGIAWAMKMEAKAGAAGKVALAFLDREATSAEDFHTGLNFAGVFRVPAVFVCINGGPGTSPVESVSETIALKALAYGIPGVRVDGADLFAVWTATRAAAARARRGEGATLIEAVVADEGDPLERVRLWLAAEKIQDASAEQALRLEVEAERGARAAGR